MNINEKALKSFILIFVVLVIIYWTELSGKKFRSTAEFKTAKEFILNDKNVMNMFGDMNTVKYIKGETFTGKNGKRAIYQFKVEDFLSKKITVWVSPDIACNGFLVKAELYIAYDDIREIEEVCVSKESE